MKSKTILIVAASVAGVALIAAGVWFWLIQPNMPNPNANIAGAGQEINLTDATSIEQAIAANGSFACTWNDKEGVATFYIASEDKMRADYESDNPQDASGGMIIADGYIYNWDISTKEGFKMPHNPAVDIEDDEFLPSFDENAEQDEDYKCYHWSVDNSKFMPPSDIEFLDYTDMQNFV